MSTPATSGTSAGPRDPAIRVPRFARPRTFGFVLLVAILYAIAPFIVARKLDDVPSLGTITLSLLMIGVIYLPIGLLTQHRMPTLPSIVALLALAVICTAVAFLAFFALIREVGPVRAPLFTYVNPVVAILLGALVLAEPLTPGLLIGFPLIIVGSILGTWRSTPPEATGLGPQLAVRTEQGDHL